MKFKFKRALSVFMALAIACSLAVVPASAAGGVTVAVEEDSWNEKELTVNVVATPGSGSLEVSDFGILVTYDTDALQFKSGSGKGADYEGTVTAAEPTAGTVKIGGAASDNSKTDGKMLLAKLVFTLKDDTETTQGVFSVSVDAFNVIPEGSLDNTPVEDVQPGANASVTLPVQTPAVEKVILGKTEANVDGAAGDSTTVKAESAKGTDITSAVTWTVSPSGEGVTVSGGTVTVDAKAKAGEYVITAASGGKTATATLKVTRAPAETASVEIIDGSSTIALSNESGNVYSAAVKDQYGDEVTTTVTWTLTGADADVAALSSTTGKSVTVTLKDTAEEGDTFTLTAEADGKSNSVNIRVVQGIVNAVAERWTGDDGSRIYIAIEDIDHANSIRDLYLDDLLPSRVSVTYPGGETDFSSQYRVKWSSTRLWELFKDLRDDWSKMSGNRGYYAVPNLGYYIESDGTEDTPVVIDYNGWFSLIIDEGSAEASGWYEEENTYVPPVASAGFTDVAPGYWAAEDINWCFAKKVMLGNSATTFNPAGVTSRQQLWMVLARVNGSAPDSMATARTWAINMGVSDGTNVSGSLTRQQMVAMLYRYSAIKGYAGKAGTGLAGFTDAGSVSAYAQEAMSWAVANGIITGNDGRLNPNGTATRAQFAAIMHRFCDTFKVI